MEKTSKITLVVIITILILFVVFQNMFDNRTELSVKEYYTSIAKISYDLYIETTMIPICKTQEKLNDVSEKIETYINEINGIKTEGDTMQIKSLTTDLIKYSKKLLALQEATFKATEEEVHELYGKQESIKMLLSITTQEIRDVCYQHKKNALTNTGN